MNVILLEKVSKLGEIGDTATVKAGYARNFLFPRGKAIPATPENLARFEERRAELLAIHNKKVAAAEARAAKVDGVALTLEVNASEEGRLFGSVGTRDIAEAVNERTDSDIAKGEVLLPHGVIRELGEYEIALDLGHDVHATIRLLVAAVGSAAAVNDDGSIETEDAGGDAGENAGEDAREPVAAAEPAPADDAP